MVLKMLLMFRAFRLDLIMESISSIISFAVAYYAMKAYRLTQNKSLMHLYFGFSVLGAGMLTRVLSTIYVGILAREIDITVRGLIYMIGIIYGIMRTIAYFLFTLVYIERTKSLGEETLAMTGIPFIMNPYFEFIQMTLLIYVSTQAVMNFIEIKNINSLLISMGFILLLISHLLFMSSMIETSYYIMGHITQLLGFTCMLIMLTKVGRGR